MKILEIKDDFYTVLDFVSRNAQTVYVSRVYSFYYDPSRVDPENVALRNTEEFVVESIVDDTWMKFQVQVAVLCKMERL